MNPITVKVLIISTSRRTQEELVDVLTACGATPIQCLSIADLRLKLKETEGCEVVFCEDTLPDGSYRDVLASVKSLVPGVPVVVCSLLGEMPNYLEAMNLGAFDFIAPPYHPPEVEAIINATIGAPRRDWKWSASTAA